MDEFLGKLFVFALMALGAFKISKGLSGAAKTGTKAGLQIGIRRLLK